MSSLFRPTSTKDLKKLAKEYQIPNFRGVYPIDKLPKKLKEGFYIYNYLNQGTSGSHWALLRVGEKEAFNFSSFGDPPPELISDLLENLGFQDLKYNPYQVQSFGSSACGIFCLAYAYLSSKGISDMDICQTVFHHNNEKTRLENHKILEMLF